MKIYIAGKITGNPDYKTQFEKVENILIKRGHSVMNPAWLKDGKDFKHYDYMAVTEAMQKVCEAVVFLPNWKESEGAQTEHARAIGREQKIFYGVKNIPDYNKCCYLIQKESEKRILTRNECLIFFRITDKELTKVIKHGYLRRGYTVSIMKD
ncbi:MAG: DUF4406 domain-containing protein [Treponema sp.]|nr:DUF4406 domain-containing protein [Treponema sp.]